MVPPYFHQGPPHDLNHEKDVQENEGKERVGVTSRVSELELNGEIGADHEDEGGNEEQDNRLIRGVLERSKRERATVAVNQQSG